MKLLDFTHLPPLSLYIHVPWCVRKCPYCDFNSHELRGDVPETVYVDALLADLEQDLPRVWGRSIASIYFGGGTPSLLSPEAVTRLLSGLRARVTLHPGAEITLEANPGTVEQHRFSELRAAGINRLSIGVQSFNDTQLQRLGRIHNGVEATRAAEAAHAAGFDNFNLDLMFGLPGQTGEQARADVQQAITLAPAHISYYQLTIEPNTLFHLRPPMLPDEGEIWAVQQQGQALLAEHGYTQYEISAYARTGAQCAHNLNYWSFGDYLGIGAGAHAKLSSAQHRNITRLWKVRHPRDYLETAGSDAAIGGEHILAAPDVVLEFAMNALRLSEGFSLALFSAHTGLAADWLDVPLREAGNRGLIERQDGQIQPTARGFRYLNDLLELFMESESCSRQSR